MLQNSKYNMIHKKETIKDQFGRGFYDCFQGQHWFPCWCLPCTANLFWGIFVQFSLTNKLKLIWIVSPNHTCLSTQIANRNYTKMSPKKIASAWLILDYVEVQLMNYNNRKKAWHLVRKQLPYNRYHAFLPVLNISRKSRRPFCSIL